MSWRMAPLKALSTTTIPSGAEVRVSDPGIRELASGGWPALFVHRAGQEIPDVGVVAATASTSEDLEYLAEKAREWAERLDEAARARRAQEDSDVESFRDAG